MKPLFLNGPSLNVRLATTLALSLVLIVLDVRLGYLESLRSLLSIVVYPVQYVVNLPVAAGNRLAETFATQNKLSQENARLREENLLLQSRFQRFAALEAENERLRRLLESSIQVGERVLVAELLAVQTQSASRQVILNKGTSHGVFVGQPVVDASGVMGQIVHVGPLTSTAMLITDANHALPVEVNRSGLRVIAAGTGAEDVIELSYVPTNADIREGDLIVTSGMGGRFPRGYPVAQVSAVAIDPGQPFARVTARPTARLSQSHEVLLVWPQHMTHVASRGGAARLR
ncbi:MAG: rod shape-determining protein MreC [Gammaproteobacteria bacterium]